VAWLRGGSEVTRTLGLAMRLVLDGGADEDILRRLKAVPGGAKALRKAARPRKGLEGYPADRVRELLLAAADGSTPPPRSAKQEQQDDLLRLDPAEGFALLATRLPALLELERRARDGVPPSERGAMARAAARSGDDPQLAAMASMSVLLKEAASLVGPKSGASDSLLASPTAASVVRRYLAKVSGATP
jgi:hypothetical protein